jgi:histidinol dehydrogenase
MADASSPLQLQRIDTREDNIETALTALRERMSPRGDVVSDRGRQLTLEVFGEALAPQQVVERICGEVRREGLPAVLNYSRQLDHAELTAETVRVSEEEIRQAHAEANPAFLATVRRIRDNILDFQRKILHQDVTVTRPGITLQQRYLPLERVGVCVPGGAAAYPSTVLMSAVPAQAAGVRQIAVVAPPTDFGANNPDVLATCHEIGVEEIYRVGGAQAVAALAYGVQAIPQVDKIVGPGNLFVALAKRLVYGEVSIDSIAGPSEVVVIADASTRPDFAAADMLAQAEHAPGASIFITWDEKVLDATAGELQRQVAQLSRCEVTVQSLEAFGAMILVRDAEEACAITNLIAPEHLHVALENGQSLVSELRHAGAIFVGNYTPVALGDYVAGPSHVLPTGGTARWASGLTANDFLRTGSIITYTEQALRVAAADVQALANKEGLTAHRASIDVRL